MDNDCVVDFADSQATYQKGGTGWDTSKSTRLSEAIAAWKLGTDFNPQVFTTSSHQIYVDGRSLSDPWTPGQLAKNEVHSIWRASCGFYDIDDSDITVHTTNGQTWYWGSDPQPQQCNLCWNGKGVLTHELGHGILLIDLYGSANCPPGPTMCGSVPVAWNTQYYSTLTTDDINAANAVY